MAKRNPRSLVYYPGLEMPYDEGAREFVRLLHAIAAISPLGRGYRLGRRDDPVEEPGAGFDLTTELDAAIDYLRQEGFSGEDRRGSDFWGERWEDAKMTGAMALRWNTGWPAKDVFEFRSRAVSPGYPHPVTYDHYSRIVETIITWRQPRYLWVGDWPYFSKGLGALNPHRTIANWLAWVPHQVAPATLPSAARVEPLAGGTLIATAEAYFLADDHVAVERANDVEVEMHEAGLLPLLADL